MKVEHKLSQVTLEDLPNGYKQAKFNITISVRHWLSKETTVIPFSMIFKEGDYDFPHNHPLTMEQDYWRKNKQQNK